MSDIKIVSKKELSLLSQQDCVRFALFCAEQVKDGWRGVPECVAAIETAERWLEGKATEEECKKAAYAAYAAYDAASARAVHAVAYAASAAYANGKPHLIKAQRNHYNELLHFDDIAEKLLLGGVV